jgi:hypothetical protein
MFEEGLADRQTDVDVKKEQKEHQRFPQKCVVYGTSVTGFE